MTAIWGVPGNVTEDVKQDAYFHVKAKHNGIPTFGLGVAYRPTPFLEFGANYNAQITVHAKGTAVSEQGPGVNLNGEPIQIGPTAGTPLCQAGGNFTEQKACVDFALPMNATIGGRYLFLGSDGKMKGDIEANLEWENWSTDLASTYHVTVDADVYVNGNPSLGLKPNIVRHEAKDTFSLRLGGSYHVPAGTNTVILRGGVAHDTTFAKDGWLRSDIDGAARTLFAAGAAYRAPRFEVSLGGGFVYEGTTTNSGTCNVLVDQPDMNGCGNNGDERPLDQRRGPDPINPLVVPEQQTESPVTLGDYKSHYVMFMLGFSTWF